MTRLTKAEREAMRAHYAGTAMRTPLELLDHADAADAEIARLRAALPTREQADALARLLDALFDATPDRLLPLLDLRDAHGRELRDVLDALRRPRGGR